jgi:GDP-D-mannose 3',5'-epimerase
MKNKIVRYHNIFGPEGTWFGGKEKAPAALCRKVLVSKNELEVFGDGNQVRTFLYIDECIKATIKVYRETDYCFPINIGSEKTVTINNLLDIICSIENKNIVYRYIDGPTGVKARSSNNELIKSLLNWSPDENLEYGIKQTYMWIKNEISLGYGII